MTRILLPHGKCHYTRGTECFVCLCTDSLTAAALQNSKALWPSPFCGALVRFTNEKMVVGKEQEVSGLKNVGVKCYFQLWQSL